MSPRITLLTAVGVVAFTVTIVGTTVLQVPTAIASAAIVRTAPRAVVVTTRDKRLKTSQQMSSGEKIRRDSCLQQSPVTDE